MNKLSELTEFGRLLHDALGLPIFIINPGRTIESEFADRSLRMNPYFSAIRDQLAGYSYAIYTGDQPVHFTRSRLHYFFVNVIDDGRFEGTLAAGPFVSERPQDEGWKETVDKLHAGNRLQFLDLYEKVALVSSERAVAISRMVYYAISRRTVDLEAELLAEEAPMPETAQEKQQSETELSRGRRSGMLHANLSMERVMLHYVRSGEKERIRSFVMESIIGEDELGILAKRSRLRSEKNLMITGIALVCRAAIEGGMHEEDAFTLNDFYIQQLEEKDSLQGINSVITEAMFDFVDRVADIRRGHYSPAVQDCLHEIANGLYGEITLDQLAKRVNFSPNYLSSLFKKEVGLTISEYIQQKRIEEAKKLLTMTGYPITDIAAWLSFHDQSYFNKVFKKWTGMTPKAYRQSEWRPGRKDTEISGQQSVD
ncbi:helix-turn-helix domain-containing protein [Paenibacillus sp. GCM10027627]|uniref:helix-turn-helix domain-containing protein n=1 Tax=unclassified Paenibacillus TaxID=185978 RepID=UPI00362B9825